MIRYLNLCLLFLLPVVSSSAQDDNRAFTLNVNVDLVEVHVTVLDEKDGRVGGLKQENFRLLEDGVAQTISVFKQEDVPVSLGLVIDNSRSIEPRKARLDAAALSFVQKSKREDETFVVHFDSEARLRRDFTNDIAELEQTLAAQKPFGQTAIYDALVLALDQMDKAKYQKKALLLITDGIDNASRTTLDEVLERVKRGRVMVFSVGLLSQSGGLNSEDSLIRIAESSGGRAYFPENVDQAQTMMERIARDLREQYTLGFFPTNTAHDGRWRSVRVEVTPPKGFPLKLNPVYRHGYYGPQ